MESAIQMLQSSRKSKPNYYPPQKPVKEDAPILSKPSTAGTVVGALALGAFGTIPAIPFLIHRYHQGKKAQAEYDAVLKESECVYNDAVIRYENESKAYENDYAQLLKKTEEFNGNLDAQISAIISNKAASESALKELYDLNIIYHKYRSLIPITMFCEYLDSGIRSELHGANGIYDLYEQQLMGHQIVGELSTVNSNLRTISCQLGNIANQLSGIERNQVLLHEEIARGNAIATQIKNGTEKLLNSCDRHLSAIETAAEITAFNAESTARRTDAMARISEYEFAAKNSPYVIL